MGTFLAEGRISDVAVAARTGKGWAEWFRILDDAGCKDLEHQEIATRLYEKHGVDGWWAQMVAVAYEQARGKRRLHERPDGFAVSASRVIAAPVSAAYKAWTDARSRKRWLPDGTLTISTATVNKSLRAAWGDGKTRLEVNFYDKNGAKCQVVAQHHKLPSAADADRMKAYWSQRLEGLKGILEKSAPAVTSRARRPATESTNGRPRAAAAGKPRRAAATGARRAKSTSSGSRKR
ncbi:MAG: hypothetical protein HY763_08015 [Planctomycetes bacterium]|nr:hypothetical protein [Planctomycetota bacterium]